MRKIYLSIVYCIAFFSVTAKAQEPVALSLEDCMNYAITHADTLKNTRLNIDLQKARNNQVVSAAFPRVSVGGDFTDYINQIQTFVPGDFFGQPGVFTPVTFTPKFSSGASITGSQIIFDGGVLIALQARDAIIDAVRLGNQLTEENVKYAIQKAYYAQVIARKQFNILNESIATARSAVNDVESVYKSGFAEKIEVDRTTVQLNNLITDSIRINALLNLSEQALKYVIGMDIEQPIVLTDTSLDGYLSDALSLSEQEVDYNQRTEFSLLQKMLELNQYDLKRYRYAAFPTLNAFANAGYNYSTNNFEELFRSRYLFSSLVGLKLSIPIFSGFLRTNQVKEAKLNIEKTKNNIHLVKETIDFQAAQAKTTVRNALLTMRNQERNMNLANNVLDLARKKYNAGVGSNQEVTLAQGEALRSQTNYFQALLDVINAQADLQRALGQFKQ